MLDVRVSFNLGPLYRFGQLRITGLDPGLETQARKVWSLKPGDPFDFGYSGDFFRAFFESVDQRKFKKFNARSQPGTGDHVMDFTVVFEPK